MNTQITFNVLCYFACLALLAAVFATIIPGGTRKIQTEPYLSADILLPLDWWTWAFNSGRIGDPYWKDNDVRLRSLSYERQELSFNFTIPAQMVDQHATAMVVAGVGDLAVISVNGRFVGRTTSLFREYYFDVSGAIVWNQSIQIGRILFEPAPLHAAYAAAYYKQRYGYSIPPACPPAILNGQCHVSFVRTRQSSYGWDGGPTFPTMAVLFPVKLISFRDCMIDNLNVIAVRSISRNMIITWRLLIDFDLICAKIGQSCDVDVNVAGLSIFVKKSLISGSTRRQLIKVTVDVPVDANIRLWWPSGYGAQFLYTANVSLNGRQVLQRRFGFRAIELVQDPVRAANGSQVGLAFYFKINNIPIFLKGSNWVPKDSFLSKVSCATLGYYFQEMKRSSFNALRICGVDTYEKDCFYDLADKYGILIWQDLMFGNALYPANAEFLSNVRLEVMEQLGRLKSHPSIIIWAGNNEVEAGFAKKWWDEQFDTNKSTYIADYLILYNDTIRTTVEELDTSRPFVLSTPSNGLRSEEEGGLSDNPYDELYGDVHFYEYNKDPWETSTYPIPRCATEFGYQSLPSLSTLVEAMNASDLKYFSNQTEHRQHHPRGQIEMLEEILMNLPIIPRCQHLANKTEAAICLGKSLPLDSLIYLTQINQAMAVRTQVEHYRRMKSTILPDGRGFTMCAMYWQLNDIWQAPTWSSIDYSGRLKMLQYYAKKFFEPLMVSSFVKDNRIFSYVISDLTHVIRNVSYQMDVFSWRSFEPVYSVTVPLQAIAPLKSRLIYKSSVKLYLRMDYHVARTRLFKDDRPITEENIVFFTKLWKVGFEAFGNATISDVRRVSSRRCLIDLSANSITPFVWLDSRNGLDGRFSDNGFTMITKAAQVQFTLQSNRTPVECDSSEFTVKTLRDVYRLLL